MTSPYLSEAVTQDVAVRSRAHVSAKLTVPHPLPTVNKDG